MKKRSISILLTLAILSGMCPGVLAAENDMKVSDNCIEYIKSGEGFSATVYNDGTGYYIGYGCACQPDEYPNGISQEQAEILLRNKMSGFEKAVMSFLNKYGISASQGQFDALCSMSYNLGTAWLSAENRLPSMLIKGVGNYSDEEIVSAFAAWCHVGGAVSEGLLGRRIIEAKMFLYGDYSFSTNDWRWMICNGNGGETEYKIYCYKAGKTYGKLPGAEYAGHSFSGWETADGEMITADSVVKENLYVYAKWDEDGSFFPDVPAGAWYYEYVSRLVDSGVISGHTDGTFKPTQAVTWGQALKLILLSAGFSEQEPAENGHWASGYLEFAENHGYVKKGSVKDLEKPVTRNEIADLAFAALELEKTDVENPFADTGRESVVALYAEGILEGSVENGLRLFKGESALLRSEICAILCRMQDYVEKTWVIFAGYRVPIDYSLRFNEYDNDLFYEENERIYYGDSSNVRYGIDVSEHQGAIDWQKVAGDGIDFAIIRVGYRGYSAGALNTDKYFLDNIRGATEAGLDVGVYFFSQAVNVEEAVEEAEYVLAAIKDFDISYPVVFDWEPLSYSGSRTRVYDGETVTDCAVAFSTRIQQEGYRAMVYYNKSMAYLKLGLDRLEDFEIWFAQYSTAYPTYIYHYDMWQYGSSGSVNGISGRVDMNISFVDYSE